ncbi:thiol-disulfide oxidoreductase DCC family protein [Sulfurovum sp.]|uniref:thiol-disulfide oxidoreductase DCC family protein n=1 Tax=Sulfurovum sp. TaxID=1969726 RepID=UPI0035625D00
MTPFWRLPLTWFKASHHKNEAILFYDGTCAFCHAIVRFVVIRDKKNLLTFSPLQGETIKEKNIDIMDMKSIILYIQNEETLYKSDASIALFERLGGIWFIMAKIIKFIPKILRDALYDLIAKIRYKIAGKLESKTCPLLPKNYQSKILL